MDIFSLRRFWWVPLVLLAGCGGSNPPAAGDGVALAAAKRAADQPLLLGGPVVDPLRGALPQAVPAAPDATALMNWAERQYAQYFPGAQSNQTSSPYTYRYYPATKNYLAVADGKVFILGPVSGGALAQIGSLTDFACKVFLEACSAGGLIEGTVATGAAVANATVAVTDRNGAAVCTNAPVVANVTGAYQCVVDTNATPPFAIVATDPLGIANPLITLLAEKPAATTKMTANVSQLTTAIAAQMDANKDAFAATKSSSFLGGLNKETLAAVRTNVAAQLSGVLLDAGVTGTFDPVATPFVGGSRTGVDKALDQISLVFNNGIPTFINPLAPDAAPITVASATTGATAKVGVSVAATGFNLAELDFSRTMLERCFAKPSTQRVTLAADRTIASFSDDCKGFLVDDAPRNVTTKTFLHNGQSAALYFSGLMASADMDGAKFNLPELMRYVRDAATGRDQAVVNLKFRDKNGVADSLIAVLTKYPGSSDSARGTDWWMEGNYRPINAFARTTIRQREQMVPSNLLATTFSNAAATRYESGLEFYIERPGKGWGLSPSDLRYVRIKGPGLPAAGLVYADVNPALPQTWMGILRADGVIPTGTQTLAGTASGTTSNIFLLQRTQGITGQNATTVRPNPFVGSPTTSFPSWAHPTMYGQAPSSTWSFDLTAVPAWSLYTFELFRNTETAPSTTFTARIVTPLLPAAFAATQAWHALTPETRLLVTDGAAAAASLNLSWSINPLAPRVSTTNAYSSSSAGRVDSASIGVPKGASSATLNAVDSGAGALFPPIGTTLTGNWRQLQARYRMLDGSYVDQMIQFN